MVGSRYGNEIRPPLNLTQATRTASTVCGGLNSRVISYDPRRISQAGGSLPEGVGDGDKSRTRHHLESMERSYRTLAESERALRKAGWVADALDKLGNGDKAK